MATKALATTKKASRTPARSGPVSDAASVVIYDVPTSEQVKDAVVSHAKLFFDGETDSGSMLADVLDNAQTPEALFAESELLSVRDHFGETFILQRIVGVRNSDFEEAGGLGIYLIVEAVTLEGEIVKIAVGASTPIGMIVKLHELEAFPWAVAFERSAKATKAGFYPVNLVSRQAKGGGKPF